MGYAQTGEAMSALNIRNVPEDLLYRIKMRALSEKKTLREAVIGALEQYAAPAKGFVGLNAAHCPVAGPLIKRESKRGSEQ